MCAQIKQFNIPTLLNTMKLNKIIIGYFCEFFRTILYKIKELRCIKNICFKQTWKKDQTKFMDYIELNTI